MDIGIDNRNDRMRPGFVAMYLNFTFQNFQPSFEGKRYRYHPDHRMSWIRHYAIHEFGHVLSLSHEQNRSDKHAAREK